MADPKPSGERVQKVLARAGLGSRREIESWISAGRIAVNGEVARLGERVTPADRIAVDGKFVEHSAATDEVRVIALNKPEGVIATAKDPGDRQTTFSFLPDKHRERWISVGRLDVNTSGLLLFTNNGELANRLMHPRYEVDREYAVRVFGDVPDDALQRFRDGIEIEGELFRLEDVVPSGGRGANRWYYCVVKQGRNREVRRIWESQGVKVSRLMRSRFGNVMLPRDLKPGGTFEVRGMMLNDLMRLVRFRAKR